MTVVVDHIRGKVGWARKGKNADTLKAFFAEFGDERIAKLAAVTIPRRGYLLAKCRQPEHALGLGALALQFRRQLGLVGR